MNNYRTQYVPLPLMPVKAAYDALTNASKAIECDIAEYLETCGLEDAHIAAAHIMHHIILRKHKVAKAIVAGTLDNMALEVTHKEIENASCNCE